MTDYIKLYEDRLANLESYYKKSKEEYLTWIKILKEKEMVK